MRKPNTHDYIVIEKEKKIILTHIIFEFILEASKVKLAMSKQTSIFQFKGFQRTIVYQGQVESC